METVQGLVEVTIPKGASTGSTLRIKGKGIKGADHYVTLKIVMPHTIDSELEELVRNWSKHHTYNPRAQKEKV